MPLSAALDVLRRQMGCTLAPGTFARLQAEAAGVRETLTAARHAGDMAPGFTLGDVLGNRIGLGGLIAAGPVVITFYRGDWCKFCRRFLEALSGIQDQAAAAGARIAALSPQPAACRDARAVFPFPLLIDTDARVTRDYGLGFIPDPALRQAYAALGQSADCQTILPVPATYIADASGRIIFSHVDSDFTRRPEPGEIVTALQSLQTRTASTKGPSC